MVNHGFPTRVKVFPFSKLVAKQNWPLLFWLTQPSSHLPVTNFSSGFDWLIILVFRGFIVKQVLSTSLRILATDTNHVFKSCKTKTSPRSSLAFISAWPKNMPKQLEGCLTKELEKGWEQRRCRKACSQSAFNSRLLSSVGGAPVCCAWGRGFEP